MDWIGNNWIWLVFLVGMIAMHLFGHRGHRHGSGRGDRSDPGKPVRTDKTQIDHDHAAAPQAGVPNAEGDRTVIPITTPANRHRHGC